MSTESAVKHTPILEFLEEESRNAGINASVASKCNDDAGVTEWAGLQNRIDAVVLAVKEVSNTDKELHDAVIYWGVQFIRNEECQGDLKELEGTESMSAPAEFMHLAEAVENLRKKAKGE